MTNKTQSLPLRTGARKRSRTSDKQYHLIKILMFSKSIAFFFSYANNQVFNKGYVYKNRRGGKGLMTRANDKPVSDAMRLSVEISGCKAQSFFGWTEGSDYLIDPPCLPL